MTINIYWACLEKEWMFAKKPDKLIDLIKNKNIVEEKNKLSNFLHCPAFNTNIKNVFVLRSLYDYEVFINDKEVQTDFYDELFFKEHFIIRSFKKNFFSFNNRYIFFTKEKSLKTTFYEYPFFEDNNITKRLITIPGSYDIGKWFRPTEFAFFLKKDYNSFKIEKNEIYGYLRFHTDQKINFIQFKSNSIIEKLYLDCFNLTNLSIKTLEEYYFYFKTKKIILKEIEKNLI